MTWCTKVVCDRIIEMINLSTNNYQQPFVLPTPLPQQILALLDKITICASLPLFLASHTPVGSVAGFVDEGILWSLKFLLPPNTRAISRTETDGRTVVSEACGSKVLDFEGFVSSKY